MSVKSFVSNLLNKLYGVYCNNPALVSITNVALSGPLQLYLNYAVTNLPLDSTINKYICNYLPIFNHCYMIVNYFDAYNRIHKIAHTIYPSLEDKLKAQWLSDILSARTILCAMYFGVYTGLYISDQLLKKFNL